MNRLSDVMDPFGIQRSTVTPPKFQSFSFRDLLELAIRGLRKTCLLSTCYLSLVPSRIVIVRISISCPIALSDFVGRHSNNAYADVTHTAGSVSCDLKNQMSHRIFCV